MGRYTGKKCRLVSMFGLTGAFFLVEIIVGYLTNSMALVADSFHMLSDIAALVIAFISVRMAPKSWSKNTFGWARAEVLGALVNAVFLVALCFSITVESLKRFYEPEHIHNPQMILWVGTMGLIVNLVGLCLFHEHGSSHGHSHGLSRSTHSHLTDLADKEEKEEIPEIVYAGAQPRWRRGQREQHEHARRVPARDGGRARLRDRDHLGADNVADGLGVQVLRGPRPLHRPRHPHPQVRVAAADRVRPHPPADSAHTYPGRLPAAEADGHGGRDPRGPRVPHLAAGR